MHFVGVHEVVMVMLGAVFVAGTCTSYVVCKYVLHAVGVNRSTLHTYTADRVSHNVENRTSYASTR